MSKQDKIAIESDAGRLLRDMSILVPQWTMLTHDSMAVWWLLKRGYVYKNGGDERGNITVCVTGKGREHYASLCANSAVTESAAAFRDEALSGLTTESGPCGVRSRQSEIERAVLPSPSPPGPRKTPESIMQDNERDAAARRKLLADLGCSEAELVRYGDEGRIRVCKECGEVGIFDRDRGSWKPMCRKCRKDRRG